MANKTQVKEFFSRLTATRRRRGNEDIDLNDAYGGEEEEEREKLLTGIRELSKHDVDESAFAIIFQLFKLFMLEKCVLAILELNWNQRLGNKKTKLNICHRMLTSSTQLQNRSFHVVERKRTSTKCQKMKNARAKRAKILFFIVKYANLWSFCCRCRCGCLSSLLHTFVIDHSPLGLFRANETNN